MLELGVNEGLTAKAVLENIKSIEKYYGVDVKPGYIPERPVQRGEIPRNPGHLAKGDPRFELILRPRGSLDLQQSDIQPCDVVFIDGDHGRKAVMHDSSLAETLVQPGGIIIWHDYDCTDVGEKRRVDVATCLEELRNSGRDIVSVQGTWLAFERR